MKTYIATLQIEDDIEIVGNIEAVASYTYRDNGTKYAYSETIEFEEIQNERKMVNEKNFNIVCEALAEITNKEGSDYGYSEACDIADKYLESEE